MTLYFIRLANKLYGPHWAEVQEDGMSLASFISNYDHKDILGVYEAEKSGQVLEDYSLVNVTHEAARIVWDGLDQNEKESPPKFVQDWYPDWYDEYETARADDEEMRRHQANYSNPY